MKTPVTVDNIWDTIRDTLIRIQPLASEAFKDTVDKGRCWDGSPSEVFATTVSDWIYYTAAGQTRSAMLFKLTIGHIELSVTESDEKNDNGDTVRVICDIIWRYFIPSISDSNKIVQGDRIKRGVPLTSLSDTNRFSKALASKFEALAEAVNRMYDINAALFSAPANRLPNASTSSVLNVGAYRVVSNICRLRLNTQIMLDRCRAYGLDETVARRLNELANEMNDILFKEGIKHDHIAPVAARADFKWG